MMNKIFCIILITTFGFIFSCNTALVYKPREPKYNIPITYNLGWWTNQNDLKIDSLSVDLVDSKLSLFNSFSLIKYRIIGTLSSTKNGLEPYIDKIHISERNLMIDSVHSDSTHIFKVNLVKTDRIIGTIDLYAQAIIDLTPIVRLKENKLYKAGQIIRFDITNEHKIQSLHSGDNYFLIKCDKFEKPIIFQQTK